MSDDVENRDRNQLFTALLLEHSRDLMVFIYSLVQNQFDAEDVYQQTSVVLWRKFDEFEIGTNFGAWANRVAHFTTRTFLRSRRKVIPCFSDETLEMIASSYRPIGSKQTALRSEVLQRCLQKLSQRERKLVERCYAPDRDIKKIAKIERRTVAAIYQAICRIRKNLYRCMTESLSLERH